MTAKERLRAVVDQLPEESADQVLRYLEETEQDPPPLFMTATPEEFRKALDELRIDPSIPALSDEATRRESIYED